MNVVVEVERVLSDKTLSPHTITGAFGEYQREKERERKDLKRLYPNAKLKWNGSKWRLRQRQRENIVTFIASLPLHELSWRSVGIAATLAKMKQFGNKTDTAIQNMKTLANAKKRATSDEERNRIDSEIDSEDAKALQGIRKMLMYAGLLTASGSFRLVNTIQKSLSKQRRNIRR